MVSHFIILVLAESETFRYDLHMEEIEALSFFSIERNSRGTNPLIRLWSRMADTQLASSWAFHG